MPQFNEMLTVCFSKFSENLFQLNPQNINKRLIVPRGEILVVQIMNIMLHITCKLVGKQQCRSLPMQSMLRHHQVNDARSSNGMTDVGDDAFGPGCPWSFTCTLMQSVVLILNAFKCICTLVRFPLKVVSPTCATYTLVCVHICISVSQRAFALLTTCCPIMPDRG